LWSLVTTLNLDFDVCGGAQTPDLVPGITRPYEYRAIGIVGEMVEK